MLCTTPFYDNFNEPSPNTWLVSSSFIDTDPSVPVKALPKQCVWNATLTSRVPQTGLTMTMSDVPCQTDPLQCCSSGGKMCAKLATCHLESVCQYHYGKYEASVKVAHRLGGLQGNDTFAFFTVGYSDNPIHNEITIGFSSRDNPPTAHCSYWFNSVAHIRQIPLPANPYADFLTYRVTWQPTSITWEVDDRTLLHVTGISGKTIPFEPMSVRLILRALSNDCNGDVVMEYMYFKYTPITP